ncbi:DUF262 domain-containing protein [Burkholderia cenocepacia]|uniref:DUF262 domain-containing protein n=1 Tax=Burkholderia cenocepacia TaxID=95486 RepID=UPI0007621FA3|nr:DUF262 domain-containing protein [Burkholderia cenocepacia]KWU17758.1 hypothetical protein AS149_13640 [Burkholderia cenocepacia]
MNDHNISNVAPARTGFYRVTTESGRQLVAEYRPTAGAKSPKAWFEHRSDGPTIAKTPQPIGEAVVDYAKASQEEVNAALHRELTLDEQIDRAYANWKRDSRAQDGYLKIALPLRRRMAVGEAVRVGNLERCEVVGVFDEGQAVAVLATHRGADKVTRTVTVWSWMHVERLEPPTKPPVFSKLRLRALHFTVSQVESLLARLLKSNVDDNPTYQRGYVWTLQDKVHLIESALARRELGKVVLVRREYPQRPQLLDGKQRVSTLLEFKAGHFAYQGLFWDQLSYEDRAAIDDAPILVAEIDEAHVSKAFILQTFLDLNAAGVPQTEAHIASVRAQLEAELARS